jgi:hypothetical protein
MDNFYEYDGKCFSLEGSEEFYYCTVCFGFTTIGEIMNALVCDESEGLVYVTNIDISLVEDAPGEIDSKYYPNPEQAIMGYLFEFKFDKNSARIR